MRYFVYKDAKIVGPLSPDDLAGWGGVERDALVCSEDLSGRRDDDWRAAGDVPELSDKLRASSLSTAVAEEPLPGTESGLLERLELETMGVSREGGDDWIAGFLDDAEFRTRWGFVIPKPDDESPQRLSAAQNRITELEGQLRAFQQRVKDLEEQQRDLLSRLRGNAQTGRLEEAPPPPPAAPAPTVPEPPPASVFEPPMPELPSIGLRRAEPARPEAPPPPADGSPPSQPPSGSSLAAGAPPPEFQKRAFKFKPPKAPAEAPKSALPKLGAAKSFRVIKKEEPAAAVPGTPVYEWNVSSSPQAGLPEAKKAAPLAPPPTQPGPLPLNPPTPVPPPPVTMQFAAPAAAASPPPSFPSLQPPPVPGLTPLTPESAPPTPAFAGPPLASAGPVFTPSRSNMEPISPATAPAEDVLKRLAKPEALKTVDKPKPKASKIFYVAGAALVLVLVASFAFFLRNPKDLKTMISMGADHKPLGVADDDGKAQVFKPRAPEPQTPPAAQQPAPQTPAPTPTASPAPAPPAPVDQSPAAIELVKGYPLDGDRGTIGQWLTYSYTANPGSDNTEEWHAGAQGAAIYTVEYRVKPGPRSAIQPIVYVFEADLERKLVKGMNPQAHELMRGPKAAPAPKKKPRPAPRRRPAAQREPAPPKEVPLMPLPSDTELLPPAEGDAQFKADTVR